MSLKPVCLAPLGEVLDARPAKLAVHSPFARAASIPVEEMLNRLHELPAKDEVVLVARSEPFSQEARELLERGGRKAEFVEPTPSTEREIFRLWRPNPFLEDLLAGQLLPRSLGPSVPRSLDLGCGSGREALALAAAGYEVFACDVLPDALEKGRDLTRRYLKAEDAPINWLQRDIEKDGPPNGPFDLITSFRFLHRPLLVRIEEFLNPGGSLVLETFTTLHRAKHGKPSSDAHVLELGEAPSLVPGLEVVHFDEAWRGEAHTARLLARKG